MQRGTASGPMLAQIRFPRPQSNPVPSTGMKHLDKDG